MAPAEKETQSSLLTPSHYDDDARSINSDRSEQDTDSEDDALIHRTSREIRAHDQTVLLEEEERDQLVQEASRHRPLSRRGSGLGNPLKGIFSKSHTALPGVDQPADEPAHSQRRQRRRERRRERKDRLLAEAAEGEDGHLMHEMEEGGMKEGSSTGSSSENEDASGEFDRRTLQSVHDEKTRQRHRFRNICFLNALIVVAFAILVLVAWRLSMRRDTGPPTLSNGTALFAPTTILISLDGFRADFLHRGLTPRMNAFVAEGISPQYMNPSFPSVTFPNHYTLVTGLYPESHGVVGNSFWDPELQDEFYYTDPDRSMQAKWWGGEPLWATAEKSGVRSAIHMWPGSEAHILDIEPSFLDVFNSDEKLDKKVSRILGLLDMPGLEDKTAAVQDTRPQLIAAYVPNVDADGHKYGPNSTEIRTTISDVDTMLDNLFQGLEERNLTSIVNVVIVSDHGMATTSVERLIQLEDLIDTTKIEHIDGWPLYGLRPKSPDDLQALYDELSEKAADNPNIDVYLRDVNMPERYHFSRNDRIAPLWIVPKTGWAIVTKDEFDVAAGLAEGKVYHPRGLHGYDHEHPLMRAIFIARGPAFPHPPNSRVEAFQNIEVYNIVCDSLHLEPRPNNGTLRLPLTPVGLHSAAPESTAPADPPVATDAAPDEEAGFSILPVASPTVDPVHPVGVDTPTAEPTPVDEADTDEGNDDGEDPAKSWWDEIMGVINDWKAWLQGQRESEEDSSAS